MYLASNDPHSPWTRGNRSLFDAEKLTLPPTLVDTKETRKNYANYLAEINQLDTDVGKIDALIKKYNLDENTVFIFTSEQGHQFPLPNGLVMMLVCKLALLYVGKGSLCLEVKRMPCVNM